MAQRIFDIQGFEGGESDDIFKGPKDSFYQAENIEIRKNLSGAKLASGIVSTGRTISGNITCVASLKTLGITPTSGEGIIVCTDTGNVYLDGTPKTTISTGTASHNIITAIGAMTLATGTRYLYYVSRINGASYPSKAKIHRSTTALDFTGGISHRELDGMSAQGASTGNAIIVDDGDGSLYIGIQNTIQKLDNIEVVTPKVILPEIEQIVGMTQFQNQFKVYLNKLNSSVQYIWDGSAERPDYRQEWENQSILGVTSDGATDYAILGVQGSDAYSDLYIIQGTQKQELRVNLEENSKSRTFNGKISTRLGMVFISGGQTGESLNYGVYTYGNYYPGTTKSLVQEYSNTIDSNSFQFHCHIETKSFFTKSNNTVYYVYHNNPPTAYASSGYVVSQMYQGNLWEDKIFNKMKVGFKLETNSSIKIYLRTDIDGTFQLAKTIDYATYGSKKGCTIYETEIKALNLGTFNELQVKAELIAGSTNTKTPTLSRITTFLETVKD